LAKQQAQSAVAPVAEGDPHNVPGPLDNLPTLWGDPHGPFVPTLPPASATVLGPQYPGFGNFHHGAIAAPALISASRAHASARYRKPHRPRL